MKKDLLTPTKLLLLFAAFSIPALCVSSEEEIGQKRKKATLTTDNITVLAEHHYKKILNYRFFDWPMNYASPYFTYEYITDSEKCPKCCCNEILPRCSLEKLLQAKLVLATTKQTLPGIDAAISKKIADAALAEDNLLLDVLSNIVCEYLS